MRIAQIVNGKAHWIFDTEETLNDVRARFAPDMVFMDAGDAQEGYELQGDALVQPQPDPAENRAAALAAIDASTRAAIVGGFVSSASGTPHRYDSDENDQKNLTLMQTVSHSPRFGAHPVYQGRIPIRAVPDGETEKTTLYLTTEQMDLLIEDLALHIGACKMAGWAAQAEVE